MKQRRLSRYGMIAITSGRVASPEEMVREEGGCGPISLADAIARDIGRSIVYCIDDRNVEKQGHRVRQ